MKRSVLALKKTPVDPLIENPPLGASPSAKCMGRVPTEGGPRAPGLWELTQVVEGLGAGGVVPQGLPVELLRLVVVLPHEARVALVDERRGVVAVRAHGQVGVAVRLLVVLLLEGPPPRGQRLEGAEVQLGCGGVLINQNLKNKSMIFFHKWS